jgi:hypothetical protein
VFEALSRANCMYAAIYTSVWGLIVYGLKLLVYEA